MVSEAGASVYSASAYASQELPDLDVSIRGAVSIARRLQDPLAELVKIDPKSIGVGQYQHDVSETMLARSLGAVVEDAVNAVGVDVKHRIGCRCCPGCRASPVRSPRASSPTATRTGRSAAAKGLKDVPRLGPKAFEQCAGFLRIGAATTRSTRRPYTRRPTGGAPDRAVLRVGGGGADRQHGPLQKLQPTDFRRREVRSADRHRHHRRAGQAGPRPRPEFKTATFAAGIEKVAHLKPGMVLEGVVTNVAAFGAFVDAGVHQDGLVQVSAMSRTFVSDPREV